MERSIGNTIYEMNDPFSSQSQREMASNRFYSLIHGNALILDVQKQTGINLNKINFNSLGRN